MSSNFEKFVPKNMNRKQVAQQSTSRSVKEQNVLEEKEDKMDNNVAPSLYTVVQMLEAKLKMNQVNQEVQIELNALTITTK